MNATSTTFNVIVTGQTKFLNVSSSISSVKSHICTGRNAETRQCTIYGHLCHQLYQLHGLMQTVMSEIDVCTLLQGNILSMFH